MRTRFRRGLYYECFAICWLAKISMYDILLATLH